MAQVKDLIVNGKSRMLDNLTVDGSLSVGSGLTTNGNVEANTLYESGTSLANKYVTIGTAQTISGAKTFTSVSNNFISAGNEINMANGFSGGNLFINHRNATGAITEYRMENGQASLTSITASSVNVNDKCTMQYDSTEECMKFVFA